MNRSILIVICDFLLVSLLAFSTVDLTKITKPGGAPNLSLNKPQGGAATNRVTAQQDMGDVMRMALEQERKNRDALLGELTRTREIVGQREQQVATVQEQLRAKEQQTVQLESARTNLLVQVAAAQTNIEGLNQQLHSTTVESVISKEQRAALEAEARKQLEKQQELQRQLADLQRNNRAVLAERGALASQLQMSEESNRVAIAQMSQLQDEVSAQRQENAKLAEGVTALATKSSDLAKEIRENTPQAPNQIFDQLTTNRVLASFYCVKSSHFGGESPKYRQAQTVLVTDGTNTFAICHIQDTPLTLWNPGAQWAELTGTLARGTGLYQMDSMSFDAVDPRIVMIPVPASAVRSFGGQVYHLAQDPYKFEDAVVVGTEANYYGQCKFQIDLTAPQYLKMDHNSLKGLFGKFNPSSGDLVFSKSGTLLGVMANNNYCVMIRSFEPAATFRLGPDGRNQPTAQTLSALYAVVAEMPYKLQ